MQHYRVCRFQYTLILSLALNLIGLIAAAWLFATLGGLGWLMGLTRAQTYADSAHYRGRVSVFAASPICNGCNIALGDSITEENEWGEFGGQWLNRGISSDRITGLRARLAEVTRHQPRQILILIGINDLLHDGRDAAYLLAQYRTLISQIQRDSPNTRIRIASILPVNATLYRQVTGSPRMTDALNAQIQATNAALVALTAELGVQYIDLATLLIASNASLNPLYTFDGLHLNGTGYQQLRAIIDK